ncbi:MAG: cupin domain-containing protein [Gammaproteobacteria bacterium TMED112]|nr:MAG: cupin domain-containing protein [Gammaproteobacteria bacterium TMED112]|tara:strand:+ start:7032 stop:7421 length:390 start_codon:yes stop_codon:yes gene_type:complete
MLPKSKKPQTHKKINFKEKFSKFTEYWQPKVVANLNDYEIKLVKIKNDFVWHHHEETDEAFIVVKGAMHIEFEDHTVRLDEGEMLVVPKGVRHKPYADKEAQIMLVEPRDIRNTGNIEDDLSAPNDKWI